MSVYGLYIKKPECQQRLKISHINLANALSANVGAIPRLLWQHLGAKRTLNPRRGTGLIKAPFLD